MCNRCASFHTVVPLHSPDDFHTKVESIRRDLSEGRLEMISDESALDSLQRSKPFPSDTVWVLCACPKCGQMFSLGGVVYKWLNVEWAPYPTTR